MTNGSISAQEELLQSEMWKGEGLARGGDIRPLRTGLLGSDHTPSTLFRRTSTAEKRNATRLLIKIMKVTTAFFRRIKTLHVREQKEKKCNTSHEKQPVN